MSGCNVCVHVNPNATCFRRNERRNFRVGCGVNGAVHEVDALIRLKSQINIKYIAQFFRIVAVFIEH